MAAALSAQHPVAHTPVRTAHAWNIELQASRCNDQWDSEAGLYNTIVLLVLEKREPNADWLVVAMV